MQRTIWDALESVGRSVDWEDVGADGVFTASVEGDEIEIEDVTLLLRAVMRTRGAA